MSDELDQTWERIRRELATAVSEPIYRIWLEPLRPAELAGGRLVVEAPLRTRDWVHDRFGRVLQTSVAAVLGPEITVELQGAEGHGPADDPAAAAAGRQGGPGSSSPRRVASPTATAPGRAERAPVDPTANLNPRLTFDQFVIGDSNRLAHAAALTVAEMPAQAYNPLFIYGPPGLGKTHLLHSIAAYLSAHGGGLSVRYTTGEAFTTEFLAALHSRSVEHFKARFRHLDVLLIDDIQFLERKARTEEEFFHTFNALAGVGSQVVVTSDRLPRDLAALEDRLRERFEAGLVADIRPPDLPTRLTILRKRAHEEAVSLDDDVLRVIAERVALNVRALEGALIRVVAFASLTQRALTPALAQEVMSTLYRDPPGGRRSLADIRQATCEHFGISAEQLVSTTRVAAVTWARQVAMFLSREFTEESLPAIGREFGGRDHSTVLHACRRAGQRIAASPDDRATVDALRQRLRSAGS